MLQFLLKKGQYIVPNNIVDQYAHVWLYIWIVTTMTIRVVQVLTKCQGHHHTGNDQLTPIKTSSSVVEVVKLMAWRQATSPLKIPTWSGGCQLLENVWRRHFTTWSGGNLQRWSRLPPSHQFDYFHHCTVGKFGLSPYYLDILVISFSDWWYEGKCAYWCNFCSVCHTEMQWYSNWKFNQPEIHS